MGEAKELGGIGGQIGGKCGGIWSKWEAAEAIWSDEWEKMVREPSFQGTEFSVVNFYAPLNVNVMFLYRGKINIILKNWVTSHELRFFKIFRVFWPFLRGKKSLTLATIRENCTCLYSFALRSLLYQVFQKVDVVIQITSSKLLELNLELVLEFVFHFNTVSVINELQPSLPF